MHPHGVPRVLAALTRGAEGHDEGSVTIASVKSHPINSLSANLHSDILPGEQTAVRDYVAARIDRPIREAASGLQTASMPIKMSAMRSDQEVATRCLTLEVLTQRIGIEEQRDALGADAAMHLRQLLATVPQLGIEASFADDELALLQAPLGAMDLNSETATTAFWDVAILLWALQRIDWLPTVTELNGPALGEVLARGFWRNHDATEMPSALSAARLRPEAALQTILQDAFIANSFAVSGGKPVADIPPASVFYVLPWLTQAGWPWGAAGQISDGTFDYSPEGVRGSKPRS